jgi:hypothetical protein
MAYSNQPPAPTPLSFELHVQANDLQQEWKRCNMVANYIAEYVAYQFSEREWAENLISTVTNEFLEAVSSLSPSQADLAVRCRHDNGDLLIEIEHGLRPEVAEPYMALLAELSGQVSDERFLGLLTADRPLLDFNQLGLAMIAHDFQARIGASYDEATSRALVQVTVPIQMPHV